MKNKKDLALIITTSIIGAIIVISVFYNLFKPKPDYKAYATAVVSYTNELDNIIEFKPDNKNDSISYITLDSKSWYSSNEIDKIKFCNAVRQTFTAYAWKYKLLTNNEIAYVVFYDQDGIKIATPTIGFGDYKILH